MEREERSRLTAAIAARATGYDSKFHGLAHARRVAAVGRELAAQTRGADVDVVEAFGLLHDAMRLNDREDPGHGKRASELARDLREEGLLHFDASRMDLLVRACDDHTRGGVSDDPTIGSAWDADRLDLPRVGAVVDPRFLSTEAAHRRVVGRSDQRRIGWRVWWLALIGGSFRLRSPWSYDVWEPGPFVSRCSRGHRTPATDCSCGVYAAASVRLAMQGASALNPAGRFGIGGIVAGVVRLTGPILPGVKRDEWRGRGAELLGLYLPASMSTAKRVLRNEYEVPVEVVRGDFESLGAEELRAAAGAAASGRADEVVLDVARIDETIEAALNRTERDAELRARLARV
jgi:uncharacterized protein